MKIKVQRLQLDAKIPTKSNQEDAGWDFYCVSDLEWTVEGVNEPMYFLEPGEGHIFKTGIAVEIPKGHCMVLFDRSGMGAVKRVHRTAGVIDSTYRGEIKVSLINLGKEQQFIRSGDKIVQGLILPVPEIEIVEVGELSPSKRGSKGFGSSDIDPGIKITVDEFMNKGK